MFDKQKKNKDELLYHTMSITMELEKSALEEANKNLSNESEEKFVSNKKINKKFLILLVCVLSLFVGVKLFSTSSSYEGQEVSKNALISDEDVNVIVDDVISFKPLKQEATQGLILFQGAKVDAKAYAPIAKEVCKKGYQVFIIDSPLDIPILASNKADKIINDNPNIKSWIVGGHSLGGVVASNVILKNNQIKGLLLLASYPAKSGLTNTDNKVLSVWGSKDGVMNFKNFTEAKEKLPADTKFVEIEGGNHSQFGDYGLQEKDNKPTIENEKVVQIVVDNVVKLFDDIKNTLN